jgi:hypothetical protein
MGWSWPSLINALCDLIIGDPRCSLSHDKVRLAVSLWTAYGGLHGIYVHSRVDPESAAMFPLIEQMASEFGELIRRGKIKIRYFNAATGAVVSLPAGLASHVVLRWAENEIALRGTGAPPLLVVEVSEAGAAEHAPDAAERHGGQPAIKSPCETAAPRDKAEKWLADYIAAGAHHDRDTTLAAMRSQHPKLGTRGSLAVWGKFSEAHPDLQLSRRGPKSKRNANN